MSAKRRVKVSSKVRRDFRVKRRTSMLSGMALTIAVIGASATASQNQDADESDPTAHSWTVETVWQLEIPKLDRKHRHLWTPELERARFVRTRTDDVLVPQVSSEEFQTFCDDLGLDDARRTVAHVFFDGADKGSEVFFWPMF